MAIEETRIELLVMTKEIAHCMIHRMTLWQFLTRGGFWRKQYDTACEELSKINENHKVS